MMKILALAALIFAASGLSRDSWCWQSSDWAQDRARVVMQVGTGADAGTTSIITADIKDQSGRYTSLGELENGKIEGFQPGKMESFYQCAPGGGKAQCLRLESRGSDPLEVVMMALDSPNGRFYCEFPSGKRIVSKRGSRFVECCAK